MKKGIFCVLFNNKFLYKDNNKIFIYQNDEKPTLINEFSFYTPDRINSIIQIDDNIIFCIRKQAIWLFSMNDFYFQKQKLSTKTQIIHGMIA